MQRGNIRQLFHDKEYGSITVNSGESAHFHKQCLWDIEFADLKEGQEVKFEIQTTHNGLLAFQICRAITA